MTQNLALHLTSFRLHFGVHIAGASFLWFIPNKYKEVLLYEKTLFPVQLNRQFYRHLFEKMSCLEADQHVVTPTSKNHDSPSLASTDDGSSPSTPRCFAAHQYELEVSPEHPIEVKTVTHPKRSRYPTTSPTLRSTSRVPFAKHLEIQSESSTSPYVVTETSVPMTKTVYLIRHAESDENRRKECLKSSVQGLGKLKLPKKEDVVASMELMNLIAQLDSNVSPKGQAQVSEQMIPIVLLFLRR